MLFSLNNPGEGGLREHGKAIAAAANQADLRIAFLASGDMSHRLTPGAPAGLDPCARTFDREFIALVERGAYWKLPTIDPELQDLAGEDVMAFTDSTATRPTAYYRVEDSR